MSAGLADAVIAPGIAPSAGVTPVTGAARYPEAVVLDWTDYCNAKCFFCDRARYEEKIVGKGGFIPFERLRNLENALRRIRILGISSGIGEPLLHPELKTILDWLYDINPQIKTRITTNGTALTAARAAWFAGHIDWLSVSLNASNGPGHMRDMFPHLAERRIDPEKRWQLHLKNLTQFIAALPPEDRPRIRFAMVAHRGNIQDIPAFVSVVKEMGGSHAVITNIAAHPETVDSSLFWVKDAYNDSIEQAGELGARLGIKVDSVRFFTSVKPVFDLDKVCRDPVDTAYISRGSIGTPCCQWTDPGIPTDVYDDEDGFERYWNHDVLRRLRERRNFASCRACGMARVFDETSFHFSPRLKQSLIAAGRLSEIENDFPDAELVRACVENRLDLPSIRRCLLQLGLPVELTGPIETQGLAALADLERTCWDAFCRIDAPATAADLPLAGPVSGIGWGAPVYDLQNRISGRWLGGSQAASLFMRIPTDGAYDLRFTLHQLHPFGMEGRIRLEVCGNRVELRRSQDANRRTTLTATVPVELARAYSGRLWLRIGCLDDSNSTVAEARISLQRLEVAEASDVAAAPKWGASVGAGVRTAAFGILYRQSLIASRMRRVLVRHIVQRPALERVVRRLRAGGRRP